MSRALLNGPKRSAGWRYPVPLATRRASVRVPVAVVLWTREVLSAESRRCWIAIGSHPSVLGARIGGLEAFSGREGRVRTPGETAAWWLERLAAEPVRREEGRP